MTYFKYVVKNKEQGLTLKQWMESFYLSKNKINYLIDNSCININGETIKNRNFVLYNNNEIIIDVTHYEMIDYPAIRYNLKIIYEDDYILVIEKPCGYIIYPENKEIDKTMANFVAYYYSKTNQNHTIRHVHRLDTDTSGCLIYAKDIFTHSMLSHYFENNETKKEYFAVVYGIINKKGVIDKKIARNRHENKMMISKTGKDALTIYSPITIVDNKTLLNVVIKTGRTHQIRVHLSSLKHPLVGDKLYGAIDNYNRVMLHCHHIGFLHPITKVWIDFYSNLPKDIEKILDEE